MGFSLPISTNIPAYLSIPPYGYPLARTLTQLWKRDDTLEDLDKTANNV